MDEAEAEVDTSFIAYQPPQLQADFLAEMQSLAMPSMSSMEAEDFRIAGAYSPYRQRGSTAHAISIESHLRDTTSIEDRKSLKSYVTAATGLKAADFKQNTSDKPGSPKVLIVSGAALRVADVVRSVFLQGF